MTPTSGKTWDLLVIGGGTAGIVGARTAAALGARTALVERARTGGDCLWTGCVPSKSLLAAAHRAADARRAEALGVHSGGVTVDFAAVMAHVKGAIATIEPDDSPATLEEAGVTVVAGDARFTGPGTATIDGEPHRFSQALVATGSEPAVPPVPGLAECEPLTSETVWDVDVLPRRLVVLGGGNIGVELGQAFARLGSDVTLVEPGPRLLAKEDPDAATAVHAALEADGVDVRVGVALERVEGDAVVLADGDRVSFDRVLVAAGRRPRGGLGLDAAGVERTDAGYVVVDDLLRTTNPRIWAAGDITGHPQFTHLAGVHGSLAASNAVLGLRRRADLSAVPRVTYTDPEVASVGAPTWVQDGGPAPRTLTRHHDDIDRAVTDARTDGFARIAVRGRRSTVVGATVVGPRAGETLAELTLAVGKGLTTSDLVGSTHPYPTYGDGPWNACVDHTRSRLMEPAARLATSTLVRCRRGWLRVRPV